MDPDAEELPFNFDVCLSYASEDQAYVGQVHRSLAERGVRVFYDVFSKVDLWGKDMVTDLDSIYRTEARYCVLFISQSYAAKRWTRHEKRSALARALEEDREYLLPVRFDDTELPGLPPTVGWLDARRLDAEELATAIITKIGHQVANFLPRYPDLLFDRFKVRGDREMEEVILRYAKTVFSSLQLMSVFERQVVYTVFLHGCMTDLPDNVHIGLDLLRRHTRASNDQLLNALAELQSLGILVSARRGRDTGHLGEDVLAVVEWHHQRVQLPANITIVAMEMIWTAREGWCEEHGMEALHRLDFSRLASATAPDSC